MKTRQAIALANHCRLACETVDPRFRYVRLDHSIVLSVNSGYE
jgi:hypothetical protein